MQTVLLILRFPPPIFYHQHGNFNLAVNIYASAAKGGTHPHVVKGLTIWKSELPHFDVVLSYPGQAGLSKKLETRYRLTLCEDTTQRVNHLVRQLDSQREISQEEALQEARLAMGENITMESQEAAWQVLHQS